jgi:hypothetical protein
MMAARWSSPRAQQIAGHRLGRNRSTRQSLRDLLGLEIGRAAAAFVRNTIGFTIGGVPTAVGHVTKPIVVMTATLSNSPLSGPPAAPPMRCSGAPPMSS